MNVLTKSKPRRLARRKFLTAGLGAAALCLGQTGHGFAKDRAVTWATEAFAPFYIPHGPSEEVRGTVDQLIVLISKEMPGYVHSTEFVPILRIIELLRTDAQVICASFLYDPQVEGFAQFSNVLFVVPPLALKLNREFWKAIGEPETVSLEEFLKLDGLVLGVSEGRNYGPKLNPLLENAPNGVLFVRSGDHFNGLAQMIGLGRINATIAYGGEVKYYHDQKNSDALVSVTIEENADPLPVYAVVPRSPWGDAFLKDFNAALARAKNDPRFAKAVSDWFE